MSYKQKTTEKRNLRRGLLIALCVLILVAVAMAATVAILLHRGRTSLATQAPPKLSETVVQESDEMLDEFTVRHNGKRYRYNDRLVNILLLGIDESPAALIDEDNPEAVQADVFLLAALDPDSKTVRLVALSRDTIAEFQTIDQNGNLSGKMTSQLALAYAYGEDHQRGAEFCRDAVSEIFHGLEIHRYAAINLSGVGVINDAVGGVTLRISEDLDYGYDAMRFGEEVTLDAKMAERYIQTRESTVTGNLKRMQRQKQYLLALFQQAKRMVKQDVTQAIGIYQAVSPYMTTDISLGQASYLLTQLASAWLDPNVRTVPGEVSLNENNYAEYHIDQEGLIELMLEVFYTEIPE